MLCREENYHFALRQHVQNANYEYELGGVGVVNRLATIGTLKSLELLFKVRCRVVNCSRNKRTECYRLPVHILRDEIGASKRNEDEETPPD